MTVRSSQGSPKPFRQLVVQIDGAARGNPGPAAIGVVVADENGTRLRALGRVIGHRTNNQAEYCALVEGLRQALEFKPGRVTIVTDSELLFCQMTGKYRLKNQGLVPLAFEARKLMAKLPLVGFRQVPRAENKLADRLANQALDRGQ